MRDTISLTRRMVESRLSYNGELEEGIKYCSFLLGKKHAKDCLYCFGKQVFLVLNLSCAISFSFFVCLFVC